MNQLHLHSLSVHTQTVIYSNSRSERAKLSGVDCNGCNVSKARVGERNNLFLKFRFTKHVVLMTREPSRTAGGWCEGLPGGEALNDWNPVLIIAVPHR